MILKQLFAILTLLFSIQSIGQENETSISFWNTLKSHCGNAYAGTLEIPEEDQTFGGKKLVMHLRSCTENELKIPFYVGDDK
jgi:hypothetical protein